MKVYVCISNIFIHIHVPQLHARENVLKSNELFDVSYKIVMIFKTFKVPCKIITGWLSRFPWIFKTCKYLHVLKYLEVVHPSILYNTVFHKIFKKTHNNVCLYPRNYITQDKDNITFALLNKSRYLHMYT